jgi:ABC-2 type transport system permease protein
VPIHDQTYRRYAGRREGHRYAWWVIARVCASQRLQQRRFLGLLLFAWSPFLVRALQVYVSSSFAQASFLAPTASTFREFLDQQSVFVFFITIFGGAGLIADDRRAHALELYLSKPLTRTQYVGGKLVVLGLFLMAVTWMPAMMLLALRVSFTGDLVFLRDNFFLVPAITLFSLIQASVAAFPMLALSSLTNNSRFVAVTFAAIVFFTAAVSRILQMITGSRAWAWISPGYTLDPIADRIFRIDSGPTLPLMIAAGVIALLIGISLWVLERQVRAIEAIA